jgi:hypothetical protein
MLRTPYWAIEAAKTLGVDPKWPVQYGYAVKSMAAAQKR